MNIDNLRDAFTGAVRRRRDALIERAFLGKKSAAGVFTFDVPGRTGYVYVRIWRGSSLVLAEAIHQNVQKIGDLPILLERTMNGELIIKGTDPTQAIKLLGSALGGSVGPHSHRLGYGLEDYVEALRIESGLVMPNGLYDPEAGYDMLVYIWPFFYEYAGTQKYWPGGTIDLTAYRPTTAGHWRWCKVGIAPDTNTAIAVAMTSSQAQTTPLTGTQLAAVEFGGDIPLAGVRLRTGATEVKYIQDFLDCRPWSTSQLGHDLFDYLVVDEDLRTVTDEGCEPIWACG